MVSSWLFNFSFSSSSGAGSDVAVDGDGMVEKATQYQHHERQQQHQQASNKEGEWQSVSGATSPMSTYAGTPKPPVDTHTSFSELTVAAAETAATTTTRRRRSSVFFKLPDLDKNKNRERRVSNNRDEESADTIDGVGLPARRLARSSLGRSSRRRASIVPAARIATQARAGNVAPIRALINDIITTSTANPGSSNNNNEDHDNAGRVSENGSAEDDTGGDDGGKSEREREALRGEPNGESLPGCGVKVVPAVPDTAVEQSAPCGGDNRRPRTSPRALSEGHRRESFRDDTINRAPKVLSAERLLADAQDVARIRSAARLRATHQGVCWMASNWCVGGKKGVLSGRRYLVLCDNTIWAELRTADDAEEAGGGSIGTEKEDRGGTYDQGGFLPIMCLDGANVQYCQVCKSNNGWIIEVFNAAADVTLWLDPATPTSLLKWGSVLCQALAFVEPTDDEGDIFPAVQEEGERDLDDEDAVAS